MKKVMSALLLICAISLHAQDELRLEVELAETTSTEKIYNFISENFVGLVGWQFSMDFDGTKMKFKEVRNSIDPMFSSNNFNEPNPGELRSVWLDIDLQSNDHPKRTILFQLVFTPLESEGTPLCFLETQANFEFILDTDLNNFEMAEIIISDDCYQGFSIFFETTSTEMPSIPAEPFIKDVSLSSAGTLSFSSMLDQVLNLSLYDMNGKEMVAFSGKKYPQGRNTLAYQGVIPGVYVLKATTVEGKRMVIKVVAQ